MTVVAETLVQRLPEVRGRYVENASLAELTWFRVGGPAEVLFTPADVDDLSAFLAATPREIPVRVIGVGSNTLVRDGGVPGVTIRLGRGFGSVEIEDDYRIRSGCAVPDVKVAKAALDAGIAGLSFYRGIPGYDRWCAEDERRCAYGRETCDVLVEARAVDRDGAEHVLDNAAMGFTYRHCGAAEDLIFVEALFQGEAGDPETIAADMKAITQARESSQPVRSRTGGSTFKNPEGGKAWQLVDGAGCRGLKIGGASVSEKHCNFLINDGDATAADLETLGETVRERVLATSGIQLEWEIKRIGDAGHSQKRENADERE